MKKNQFRDIDTDLVLFKSNSYRSLERISLVDYYFGIN